MDERISAAWRQAAVDLGIMVVAPFSLAPEGGEAVWFEAHVLEFGGPKGTSRVTRTAISDKTR
jgi:hypothetical protein